MAPNLWPYVNFLLVYFLYIFSFILIYDHGKFKGINIYSWMCYISKWKNEDQKQLQKMKWSNQSEKMGEVSFDLQIRD